MKDIKIFNANEARTKTDETINNRGADYINQIFTCGIQPSIDKGVYECTVRFDRTIPNYVLTKLKSLGYDAKYFKEYDQREGEYDNLTKITVKW